MNNPYKEYASKEYVDSKTSNTIAVDKGGTGATDAATARTNLGITPANIGAADATLSNVEKDTTPTSGSTKVVTSGGVYAALAEKAPKYTYGTTDLTAGTSPLETGTLYFVYE